jgi:glycosyltransferase involved in cell wall biosynthesis
MERYGLRGKTVLMTLGRLVGQDRHKGYDEVIEALPALIGEIPDVCYLIVGKGNDRKRLEEKAKAFGVHDQVIFSGFVPEEEKVDHYRLADTFIMPSRGEGFGIVILEALACGVPVIASSVDGSREAVRNGELGIMVDPSDQQEIKDAILEALTRPKGVVPEGLEYFSSQRFEIRCHQILDSL